jgi:7-cyano-7-deazaguanine reductase
MVLGKSVREPVDSIESIKLSPSGVLDTVSFIVREFTAVCPVTGQPDYYDILIEMEPDVYSIESKSLKLWLWQYRNKGIYCETLAREILDEVERVAAPVKAAVTVTQASRGGIQVIARASSYLHS